MKPPTRRFVARDPDALARSVREFQRLITAPAPVLGGLVFSPAEAARAVALVRAIGPERAQDLAVAAIVARIAATPPVTTEVE